MVKGKLLKGIPVKSQESQREKEILKIHLIINITGVPIEYRDKKPIIKFLYRRNKYETIELFRSQIYIHRD